MRRAGSLRSLLLPLAVVVACDGGKEPIDSGVEFEGPVLAHTPPDAVVEGTALSLVVTATDADDVASVTLYHRISGDTSWVQAPMVPGEGDSWTAELEASDIDDPGIEYYFKAVDGGDTPASSYLPLESTADPFVVAVAVVGRPLPFLESFEHADDEELTTLGWANASLAFRGYGWETTTAQSTDGTRSVFHSRGHTDASEMEDWLITPALDLSAVATAQVSWQERGANVSVADHGLYVSTGSRDPADGDYVAVAEALPAPTEGAWGRSAIYDLSAYAGSPTVYLAWRFVGDAADDWYIDDVRVTELAPDLTLTAEVEPSPIDPGGTGTFRVHVDNAAIVDAAGLTVSVAFPDGGASVAEASVPVDTVPAGGSGSADLSLTVDAATPDNSYVPYVVTATDGASTWTAEGDLLVGLASTADIAWSPSAEGAVVLTLGVGDPDAPSWEQVVYEGTTAAPVELSVDITDQGAFLPPAAGDQRWFLLVSSEVAGAVDALTITHDGVAYDATELPLVLAAESTYTWLPEPPAFEASVTTAPDPLVPGQTGAALDLRLYNVGAATQGGVVATLASADADLTVTDGGPVVVSDGPLAAGETVDLVGVFDFDVAASHVDSSPLSAELVLDDGVESWLLPLELPVPYPSLTLGEIEIDDDNRDGELDADEEADLELEIVNAGDLSTDGELSAVLSVEATSTASATIEGNPASYRTLLPGRSDTPDDPWTLQIDGGADGDTLDLLLTLTDDVRSYEVRTTLRLGEPPWAALDSDGDAEGDVLEGWDFDLTGGQWRVDDGVLQLRLSSAGPFDPDTLFIESWGYSTVADWTLYRIVLQSGVATVEGYDGSGFTTISSPVVSYPSDTVVQLDITLADLGLSLDTLSLGFASGWCGPPEYYCDHFPDGWGYPYDTWYSSLFFDLSW